MEKQRSKYCNCLYYSANALSRVMTKMADEEFAVTGLTSSYALLLMAVNDNPGIQPKELSVQMQLTPSTVTRLIEKLENKGLVSRQCQGRCKEVHPTEKSEQLQVTIKAAWKRLFNRYSEILGVEESKALTNKIYEATQELT